MTGGPYVKKHYPLQDIDLFASTIVYPKIVRRLPGIFFQTRLKRKKKHIMASASETLTALEVLRIFIEVVLEPANVLPSHCRCLKTLERMVGIYQFGDRGLDWNSVLQKDTESHHEMYLQTYGPELMVQKHHLIFHPPENWALHNVNLNCFNPERQHREAKTVGKHSIVKDYMIQRKLLSFLVNASTEENVKPVCLSGTSLITKTGQFQVGDVVLLRRRYACARITSIGQSIDKKCQFARVNIMVPGPSLGQVHYLAGRSITWALSEEVSTVVTNEEITCHITHMAVTGGFRLFPRQHLEIDVRETVVT